ncbi:hypothetical protein [Listeria booriae]|uniref:hypothetical protein n=2 Tax=Listeria booriae TaxID=1552123 RepID=UPI0016250564|nr:hypothetical protein [Listeria booriae]MBC1974487.1 hypothetical protein [Listeria booriae]MBC1982370.1 hypothetical protein [Listeria booriae]MBC2025802.1 hypothetical protein [Listeria booriae]MBC2034087.1 hypothetical protein [Listeria booriae]MBC2049212.1 hypothetical protein [Listeria booriae]
MLMILVSLAVFRNNLFKERKGLRMMNIRTRKLVIPLVATTLVLSAVAPAFTVHAEENSSSMTEVEVPTLETLSDEDIAVASNYISFDTTMKQFVVDSTITDILSAEKVALVKVYVNQTNAQLADVKQDGSEVASVVEPNGKETVLTPVLLRGVGVNSITFHWNYARIKIKAGSLKAALAIGFTISSVYVPAKVVASALAAAGVAAGLKDFKNGIWFDYNYVTGGFLSHAGIQ